MNMNDERKDKIWEELLSELDSNTVRPDEKTIKILMKEKDISYGRAKKYLSDLEKAGKVTVRSGKQNEKIYRPV